MLSGKRPSCRRSVTRAHTHTQTHTHTHTQTHTGIDSAPKVAVLRTGKRTRYAKSEDDVTAANLEKFLERVLNSDVQYTNLKGGPPELTKIEPPADDKKKKK